MPIARVNATEQAEKITVQTKICMKGLWIPGSVMMRASFPTHAHHETGGNALADEVTFRIDVLVEAGVTVGQHQLAALLSRSRLLS
jgi:hypothetical protein